MDFLIANEGQIRFGVFFSLFILFAVIECFLPKRTNQFTRKERWISNWAIMITGAVFARIILPFVPVSVAFYAQTNGYGLLNIIDFRGTIAIIIGILFLDFMIYVQHILVHRIPILWKLHRLHHADLDYDVTTAIRFHPLEIILSLLYKMALIFVFGIDPLAVIILEIILNGMAMFNHANIRLPETVDRILRLLVVTPDMHRVHHSAIMSETDSNFGFNISIWDRLFKTYCAQPQKGHTDMDIGLEYFREKEQLGYLAMLKQPFKNPQD